MIEVEHLTKKYGELVAVKDLSFKVDKGNIWGLLGPNAAGKTTTMRILTGYIPATDGKATVANLDIFEQSNQVKKIIGYLPEVLPLYPEMTVHSFLSFVSEIKQIPSSQRKEAVDKAIGISGLESVRGRLIRNISRGYKQRVGIAQALIHDPQILILDEPTQGLDPAQIIEIRQLIKSLKGERTILISTHILAEVTQVCDGAVIINKGILMASGSLEDLTASFKEKEGVVIKLRKEGKDFRDEITRLIVENDLGLMEMRPLGMGIEDLYIRIISGGIEQ